MNYKPLVKGTVIKTAFIAFELLALIVVSIFVFSNDGESPWGYWGTAFIVFLTLSPIFVYVISNAFFNAFNLIIVLSKHHTPESIKKYYKITIFLINLQFSSSS